MAQAQVQPRILCITSVVDIGPIYRRQGPSYVDDRWIEVVTVKPEGSALIALAEGFDAGYPYRKGWLKTYVAVTNETELLVIKVREVDNTSEPEIDETMYVVYIKNFGWWAFEKNDAVKIRPLEKIPDNVEWEPLYPGMKYS